MSTQKTPECDRYVKLWALPGLHPSNLKLFQILKEVDTSQFTKNMDSVGTVSELDPATGQWKDNSLIAMRTDAWSPGAAESERTLKALQDERREKLRQEIKGHGHLDPKQTKQFEDELAEDPVMKLQPGDVECQRLVLKLFRTTGKTLTWAGTIEEVMTSELEMSLGCNSPLITLAVVLPRSSFVTTLQQDHRTFRLPSIFSFPFFHDDKTYYVLLKRRWLSLGAEFDVVVEDKSIGLIDEKLLTVGMSNQVTVGDHPLATCPQFMDLLTLFAASSGFHSKIRKNINERVADYRAGNGERHVIDDKEMRLLRTRHHRRKSG